MQKKLKVLLSFGTRPEAIKMAPLVLEMKKREELEVIVCVTGQHSQMLEQVLSVFEIKPDYNLAVMQPGQTLFDVTANILTAIKPILEQVKPDIVLVHGDTTSTFAVALAAFYLMIPVGHVEAGLRTHDIYSPFPEEYNRQAVGLVARYHFAPTTQSANNLLAEGKNKEAIYITGNTGIDALKTTVKPDYTHELFDWVGQDKLILLTAHRRENLGKPMENMFAAIKQIVSEHPDVKVIYPVHLNPLVKKTAEKFLDGDKQIKLIDPLEVIDFHNFLSRADIILTDSGGIQEEAPSLGVPVLVMRDTTERPEGVESGTLKLAGTSREKIYSLCKELLTDDTVYAAMSNASNPYGDGSSSKQITDIIIKLMY
ncbi:UDP-N-acetyl glucosamine-2-epimerase [Erysipelotrichaceae bacterium]|nr:UDP-N-acetyl glucosamine-2-epimerase [Erysipelotrichaceae bacterium]